MMGGAMLPLGSISSRATSLFGGAAAEPLLEVLGERTGAFCGALSRRMRLGRGAFLLQWRGGGFLGLLFVFALGAGDMRQEAGAVAMREVPRRLRHRVEQR